jgi:uncharacterized protein (TIGR02145 family)
MKKLYTLFIVSVIQISVYAQDVMRIHQTNGHIFQFPTLALNPSGDSVWVDDINVFPHLQSNITSTPGPIIQDIDGNQYPTIILGNGQHWMAENLRTTHFSNGDTINIGNTNITTIIDWYAPSDEGDHIIQYGNQYATDVIFYSGNVCPTGWHVASIGEWESLITYIDNSANNGVAWGVVSRFGGGVLKDNSMNYWLAPNALATNAIGFNAVPASLTGSTASFWAKGPDVSNNRVFKIYFDSGMIDKGIITQSDAYFSIRCIKD